MTHQLNGRMPDCNSPFDQISNSFESIFWIVLFFFMIFSSSCTKDTNPVVPPPPAKAETIIMDLGDMEIPRWGHIETIDFEGDRFPEFIFEILPVGDWINRLDRYCYNVKTTRNTALPVNERNEVPHVSYGIQIPLVDFKGYEWWPSNEITLLQKIVPETGTTWWEGNWMDKTLKYLPFQVLRQDGKYAGWLEISTNTQTEKAIIHRAGISNTPNVAIKAGI